MNLRLLLALMLLAAASSAPAGERAVYLCYSTTETMTIDGRADEAAWAKAPVLDFILPITHEAPVSPTKGRLLWDSEYLYIYYDAVDRDLRGEATGRDVAVFHGDCLEAFFKPVPEEETYFNFEIGVRGAVYDAKNPGNDRAKWDCEGLQFQIVQHGTLNQPGDEDRGWNLEMAIPLRCLREKAGEDLAGTEWLFHLSRYDYATHLGDKPELSSTTRLSARNYHLPQDWAILRFVE